MVQRGPETAYTTRTRSVGNGHAERLFESSGSYDGEIAAG